MRSPKDISTFLKGFNLGAILTTISLLDVLFKCENKYEFFLLLFMVIINGVVVGIVMQYVLIHSNVTRNMVYTFLKSKDKIPPKLLKMREDNLEQTLMMMAGIQLNIKKNLVILIGLLFLLLLSLCLPILYGVKNESTLLFFSVIWSTLIVLRVILRSTILINNSRYLMYKIDILFGAYNFEGVKSIYEKLNDDSEVE